MEISLLGVIGIGLATMFFGYFFGLFEGRGQGYKKRRQEEASDPALQAARQAPAPQPLPPPMPVVQAQPAESPLLKLTMDASQQPCLDLDGQRIDTTQMEPVQRRRLIDLMVLMRPWIESGPVARQQQPAPAIARATGPLAAQPAPPAVPAGTTRATVPPFDTQPTIPPPAPTRTTGPLTAPAPPAEPAAAPTTMVGQIDAILQTRLLGTPLATRGIRLVESMQGGAMVVVGLNRYAAVGEVPDPEVQAIIRAAIAEWESKYTPG